MSSMKPVTGKGAPAPVKGTATVENGVQVVKISLKNGYYTPNEIELKAGMPMPMPPPQPITGGLSGWMPATSPRRSAKAFWSEDSWG